MLADIPALILGETLCHQLTLPQLQQYFQIACLATPQNPDILPNTLMNVAYQILPNIFLKRSDEFMTTLIQYFAAKNNIKESLVYLEICNLILLQIYQTISLHLIQDMNWKSLKQRKHFLKNQLVKTYLKDMQFQM